jgi:hypothetical protein
MTIGKVVLIILGVVGFVVIQTFIAAQDSSTWGISGTIISYVPLAFSIGILITAFKGGGKKGFMAVMEFSPIKMWRSWRAHRAGDYSK